MSKPTSDRFRLVLLGSLVAFGPLSIDLYLPALPAIADGLGATAEAVQASVSVFLAGFAFGMLIWGPLSDRLGRRSVLLAGIALFVAASFGCMLAGDARWLVVARLLQSLGGAAASVLARAVVRDLYAPGEAIRHLSTMAIVTAIAPLVAPLLGSGLLAAFGWRGTFAALVVWGGVGLIVVHRALPETLPFERRHAGNLLAAFAGYGRILASPGTIALVAAGGGSFAAMFAYIAAGPFWFITHLGLSPQGYGLVFALNACGIVAANWTNGRLAGRIDPRRVVAVGSGLALAGMALFATTLDGPMQPTASIVALFFVVAPTGLLGANCIGLLMAEHPTAAGTAAALFGAAQFGFGVAAAMLASIDLGGPGRGMALAMAVATAISALGSIAVVAARRTRPP